MNADSVKIPAAPVLLYLDCSLRIRPPVEYSSGLGLGLGLGLGCACGYGCGLELGLRTEYGRVRLSQGLAWVSLKPMSSSMAARAPHSQGGP